MTDPATEERLKRLKLKANNLPLHPGVYIMKNKKGEIIYIGKAKSLKNRVTQYFGKGSQHTEKVRKMVSLVYDFEYILCDSEFEALILENSLIKQNQPKYNILLKDDKGYFYIKFTDEKWQKIETAKNNEGKGEFIGPYNSGFIVKETVDQARKIFKLPDCGRSFDRPSKPCLNYHIGFCEAPCRGKISHKDYMEGINSAKEFIKSGETRENIIKTIREKMEYAAEQLDFEQAARLRDRINAINKIKQKQRVVSVSYKEQDVIASAFIGELACVAVFTFRNYMLCKKQHYFVDGFKNKTGVYSEFLQQYYDNREDIPKRIVIDSDEDFSITEMWLSEKRGGRVDIINPKQGEAKETLQMCITNAAENLAERTESTGKDMRVLNELAQLLGLKETPRHIEAYDISNTSGDSNVAAMVVFKDAKPHKASYRRFKIKGFDGQDDYRSMEEVLTRRLEEYKKGEDTAFSVLPDLILLDGAKGQINSVLPVFQKFGVEIPVFGMVKDTKHRTRAIATTGGDISIKSNRGCFAFVTHIQDEVHRFAISYHKRLRSKKMLSSELLEIEGIGAKRAELLMKHFKTIKAIREADIEQLIAVKGISQVNAQAVYSFYH